MREGYGRREAFTRSGNGAIAEPVVARPREAGARPEKITLIRKFSVDFCYLYVTMDIII